ncbi:MAG: acyltransferase [Scytonematopsis contorta HA4267-MV1]|jgi:galactoside O-acetyltransferase|nr:acyltransferase [Scytonematopsis contorta HA4267-MV1]
MNQNTISRRLQRLQELLITALVGDIHTIFFGTKLRSLLYKNIFNRMGKYCYIQHGVEFLGACNIDLGNRVYIHRNTRIDTRGKGNNKLILRDGVTLDLGVCIGGLDDTCIQVDERAYIGSYVCIGGPGDIKIGKDCMIASHTGIYANNHNFADTEIRIAHQGVNTKGIVIEDDCWLGDGVTVLDDVTIGRGSVIGAGSVVTKDIPPFSVAVGVPAKVIKSRKQHEFEKLIK